jgi:hypothetical protein
MQAISPVTSLFPRGIDKATSEQSRPVKAKTILSKHDKKARHYEFIYEVNFIL